jgi:hypothetical protein
MLLTTNLELLKFTAFVSLPLKCDFQPEPLLGWIILEPLPDLRFCLRRKATALGSSDIKLKIFLQE